MPPNLRSVVTQGWRSVGSRRNFSSSRGSDDFRFWTWHLYGYTIYGATEWYKFDKLDRECEELFELNSLKLREKFNELTKK